MVGNWPPTFETDPPAKLIAIKTQTPQLYSYSLPAASDPDGDAITMTLNTSPAVTFITLTTISAGYRLEIADLSSANVIPSTTTLTITISDGKLSTVYNIEFTVDDPCLTTPLKSIIIPNLTAQVLVSEGRFDFEPQTLCGPIIYSLVQSYDWITL